MPRIPTSVLRKAHTVDPFLPPLLGPCRDLHAAQNELRWLQDHVKEVAQARRRRGDALSDGALLRHLIRERRSGKPLQYLLGSEYFGNVQIRCRPGVLIPRCDGLIASNAPWLTPGQTRHSSICHPPRRTAPQSSESPARTTRPRSLHRHRLHSSALPP